MLRIVGAFIAFAIAMCWCVSAHQRVEHAVISQRADVAKLQQEFIAAELNAVQSGRKLSRADRKLRQRQRRKRKQRKERRREKRRERRKQKQLVKDSASSETIAAELRDGPDAADSTAISQPLATKTTGAAISQPTVTPATIPRQTSRDREGHLRSSVVSSSCRAINVQHLHHVELTTADLGNAEPVAAAKNETWQRGHYPYAECDQASSHTQPQPSPNATLMAVLMVASSAYSGVVPTWAARVHRTAGLTCVFGSIGADRSMCALAAANGCRCMLEKDGENRGGKPDDRAGLISGWIGARAQSVRQRFAFALQLMEERLPAPTAVLMHDADVFFQKGGLRRMLAYLHTAVKPWTDFVVSHNGQREEVYDDLNWGSLIRAIEAMLGSVGLSPVWPPLSLTPASMSRLAKASSGWPEASAAASP